MLLYASKYHDVQTVVNASGRYVMGRGIAERLGNDFLERIKKEGFLDVKNKAGKADIAHLSVCILELTFAQCLPNLRFVSLESNDLVKGISFYRSLYSFYFKKRFPFCTVFLQ